MNTLIKSVSLILCLGMSQMITAQAHNGQGAYVNSHQHYGNHYGISLYSGRYHTGAAIDFDRDVSRLDHFNFNDRTRSIAVSGTWEICQHADFLGRCVIISEDVLDLDVFGLLNELTAIRLVPDTERVPHGFVFIRDKGGRIHEVRSYYAGLGYPESHYNRYNRYSWHPLHITLFANYGHYHPRYGHGRYGFRHPRYKKYAFSKYAPHYTRGFNTHTRDKGRHNHRRQIYANSLNLGHNHRQGHRLNRPVASRRGDATLFTHGDRRGRSVGINGSIPDLNIYGFNDRASSMDIREGRWEVCEHANFRGNCQIVDASLNDFNFIGLNDRVTSIRRVGPERDRDRDIHRGEPRRGFNRNNGQDRDYNRNNPYLSNAAQAVRESRARQERQERLDRQDRSNRPERRDRPQEIADQMVRDTMTREVTSRAPEIVSASGRPRRMGVGVQDGGDSLQRQRDEGAGRPNRERRKAFRTLDRNERENARKLIR